MIICRTLKSFLRCFILLVYSGIHHRRHKITFLINLQCFKFLSKNMITILLFIIRFINKKGGLSPLYFIVLGEPSLLLVKPSLMKHNKIGILPWGFRNLPQKKQAKNGIVSTELGGKTSLESMRKAHDFGPYSSTTQVLSYYKKYFS